MRVLGSLPAVVLCAGLAAAAGGGSRPARTSDADRLDATPAVPATSWASFRNGNHQRGIATCELPDELELLWKFPTQDGWVASVAIVGDRIYAPALTGFVYCLDRRTGRELWKYRSIDDPDPEQFAPGFKAAPRVTADMIYVGDEDGVFHTVDSETGKRKWMFTTGAEIAGCAAVYNDRIIVGSHDSFLYCFERDGTLAWKLGTEDRINCSAAIADNFTFVTGCDEHMRVIDVLRGEQQTDVPLGTYLIASPAIVGDMLYVGTYDSEVVAVNWKAGTVAWRYRDPMREFPYHASAAVTDDRVIVGGHDKQMHCIDRATGKGVWTFATRSQINSSAAVVGDRLFFGSGDGNIYGLNFEGKQVWKFPAGGHISAGVAIGEGVLVVGEEGPGGNLYCFGASPAN